MRSSLSLFAAVFAAQAFAASLYAPTNVACPSKCLIRRSAIQLSDAEESYRISRKAVADIALREWLIRLPAAFVLPTNLPTLALTSSGGGFRAMLVGAGVVAALDSRDPRSAWTPTAGLYQSLTYHAGLSGGSWLLSALSGNNFATVSTLYETWAPALANGLFSPAGPKNATVFSSINSDLAAKKAAGFDSTIVDGWSRLLSYVFLPDPNKGAGSHFSAVTKQLSYLIRSAPFPIITALNVDVSGVSCVPEDASPTWEFTPVEMGSWAPTVSAFVSTQYLGTVFSQGVPVDMKNCINGFDNLGYITGTSSSLFNDPGIQTGQIATIAAFCQLPPSSSTVSPNAINTEFLADVLKLPSQVPSISLKAVGDLFAAFPNPFLNLSSSPAVSAQKVLSMVDGGEAKQINPIFPFLVPARKVDVIIVNDNDANQDMYPNGTSLHDTYLAATAAGLSRMPFIPDPAVSPAAYASKGPVFFGCGNADKATIVWVPNGPYTPAGAALQTSQTQYNLTQSAATIANGVAAMAQTNDKQWGVCLGCAFLQNSGTSLPPQCGECFSKYCFKA